jgi:hypothetical protein
MSKSYKHYPCCTVYDYGDGKTTKNFANRMVRNCKEIIQNGCSYKKLYKGWVKDYQFYSTKQEWIDRYERMVAMFPWYAERNDFEEEMEHWYKYYYRK